MNKVKILLFVVLIPLGATLFVYAEYDDSPGGQLIGLAVAIIGVVGLIRMRKK